MMVTARRMPVPEPMAPETEEKPRALGRKEKEDGLTKEVSQHRQSSNAQTSKCSSSWDVAIQLMHHRLFSMATHDHLLLFQLLGYLHYVL